MPPALFPFFGHRQASTAARHPAHEGRGTNHLSRPLRIALERRGYRAAHAALRAWWFVRRPYTRGVKCILRDGDRVLFVRHTYGRRDAWEIPGGGLRRGEAPESAVRREMREELGIGLAELREAGRVEVTGSHKRTLLHCFEARPDAPRLRLAAAEIAEARWAPPDAPPRPLGPDAAILVERFVR